MENPIRPPKFAMSPNVSTESSVQSRVTVSAASESAAIATARRPVPNRQKPQSNSTPAAESEPVKRRESPIALDAISIQLQRLVVSSASKSELIQRFVEINCRLSNAIWSGHFLQNDSGQIICSAKHDILMQQNLGIHQSSLLPAVSVAIATGCSKILQDNELTVIAVPVFDNRPGEAVSSGCLCVALNLASSPAEPFLLISQMVASTLSQWHERNQHHELDWQIESTTAIAELSSKIVNADGARAGAILAANELASFLHAPVVGIGYCRNEASKRTRIQAVSGVADIDPGGKQAALLQSVLNEALIRNSVTTMPRIDSDDRSIKLAHQQLLEQYPRHRLVSSPLTTAGGKTIGAWLCLLPDVAQQHEKMARFATVASSYLADALDANKRASLGAASRLVTQSRELIGGKVGRVVLVAFAVAALVLMIPVSHRVACDCELQPVVRRFAVAPHDGILLESLVQPGDIVSAGQVIARMDDRELTLQLYGLLAERETAVKKLDVSRSTRDAAATQIAEMELEQLETQIELLEFKKNNLEIKNSVAGIVLQGDLEDAQGAPVRIGDVLAEVAPLGLLRLELNVAESDVSFVELDQSVSVVLDGNPLDALTGRVELIRPASETRGNKNVFVAEITIDNSKQLLRPGMQGRAKISAGTRALGWILFHKPFERVYKIFR